MSAPQMYIYLVERKSSALYDHTQGMVIAARNSREARRIALSRDDDDVWAQPNRSVVERIGTTTKFRRAQVVLVDFNAG